LLFSYTQIDEDLLNIMIYFVAWNPVSIAAYRETVTRGKQEADFVHLDPVILTSWVGLF
jgi:hypothetical protein